ncbi:MAG: PEGA domain-containing protein [Bacteroidales bacterium]|nr:PEGA domain-containing protein [Bacteroidales bacterium]
MKKLLILFFLTLICGVAYSQNISVSSFRCIENDITARTEKVTDQNGELCALIILNTPVQGFEFGGCSIETTKQKTGEIWLFVSPGVKFITIKHRDLGSLRNYPFPMSIKSGTTYEMVLKTAKITQIVEEAVTEQYLIIKSNTENANIFINNEFEGASPVRKYLPIAKEHTYRVEAPFYHTESGKVKLKAEEKTTLEVDLKPAFGYLKVNTTPENGAKISINGEFQEGSTPLTSKKLKSGVYSVQALKPMYKSAPVEVHVQDGKTTEVNINLIPTFAQAEITCQDQDAEIYIDGEKKANGSFKGQLDEGTHQLEVRKQSHRTLKKTINVLSGQTLRENIEKLQAINGKLNLDSNPFEAEIYIDAKHYGQTPMQIPNLLIGEHNLQLKKEGFKDFSTKIKIEENKIAQYKFTLQEKPKQEIAEIKPIVKNVNLTEYKNLKTLNGDSDWVNSVAYSPDGTKIISGSYDNTIKIWDANTGQCLKTLEGHSNWVYSVAYSPDGTKIISGSLGGIIKIWNANTGQCLKTLKGHPECVFSVAYSPDGTKIISGSVDPTIKIWDANTGQCLKTLEGHSYWVNSVAYSPDGTKIVSGSTDETIKIWDANTGQCLKTLEGHSDDVTSVAYSLDGTKIISGSYDKTIKIWDANTGQCLQTLEGHSDYVRSVSYSPDGTKIISGSYDKTIKIWGIE